MNFYTDLQQRTIISRVQKYMFPSGTWYVDPVTQKITNKSMIYWDMNWVFTANEKRKGEKHCGLLKTVLFECFGLHPQFCKEVCHKLVVHPRTFHDLWRLHSIQHKLEYESKCGIEGRQYTSHSYGGYFYCYSMEEAREKRAVVQDMVDEHFREPVDVKLKRGCTEMEDRFGLSSTWKSTPARLIEAEEHYSSYFDFPSEAIPYPTWMKPDIMLKWFAWAEKYGDKTVEEFNNNKPLTPIEIEYY